MTQHIVFGSGLIGSYLGAVMQSQQLVVTLVGRRKTLDAFKQGITLTDYHGHKSLVGIPNMLDVADTQPQGFPVADFLWLTVKCTGIKQAIDDMAPFVKSHTVILCCQNGLGSDRWVKQAFAANQVLSVVVPFNVVQLKAGHLHRGSEGALTIEDDLSGQVEQQIQPIHCDLLPIKSSKDIQSILWAKLQLNLANAVNALADIPVKSMLQQRAYRKVIAMLMQELLLVSKAKALTLPKLTAVPPAVIPLILGLPDGIFRLVANKMLAIDPEVRTSMWWDLQQHKLTEIDYLNGEVISQGKQLGIDTPFNQAIVDWIHRVESGDAEQGVSAAVLLNRLRQIR